MINYSDIANTLNSLNINHPIWANTCQESYAQVLMAAPSEVVSIKGPPRVGKSRLSIVLREMLNPPGVGINDKNSLSIGVRASNCSTNGAFSTKAFARKAVTALNHPIFATDRSAVLNGSNKREVEADLWLALECGLPAAGKRYVFIDEAHNITRGMGKHGAGAILDAWKCMAEDANVVLVLTGTYELHMAMQEATHVLGRNSGIHFPRYQVTRDGIIGFNQILKTYASHLPLAQDIDNLCAHSEFLYSGSLGCIGLLERWFRRALAVAMANNKSIDLRTLEQSRTSNADLQIALNEIQLGEQLLTNSDSKTPNSVNDINRDVSKTSATESSSPRSKHGKSKPFVCKPVRRKAGERLQGAVDV